MALQIDDQTDFNYLVPLAPSDVNLIRINPDNGVASLTFHQIRANTGEHIDKVDVTGAVLMSIDDLRSFRDAITDNLDQITSREK